MSLKIQPTKLAFKKAESEWYNYHNTIKEIAKLREEIMNPTKELDENTGGGKSNIPGKPTERIATRLVTHKQLLYLQEVVEAIEKVYNACPSNYKELIRLRYWNKNNPLTWEGIALRLNVSERQARRWRDEIIYATLDVLGWR